MEKQPLPNSKPPYLLGLLGIIPLVGGFVGIGLILYGVFRYKDKKLVWIGVADVAFTVLVYSSLFWGIKNSNVIHKGFSTLAQKEMNTLIRYIEFYKLENGQYPDSLEQVKADDDLVNTFDPTQEIKFKKSDSRFWYRRLDDRYVLLSVGEDGLPYTKDDLYPTLKLDTNKFGWRKSF